MKVLIVGGGGREHAIAASNITHANMEAVFTLTDMPFKSAWFIGFDNE